MWYPKLSWVAIAQHAGAIASGVAVFAAVNIFSTELNRMHTARNMPSSFSTIDANNILQYWRLGATKAENKDAEVRFVYTYSEACDAPASVSFIEPVQAALTVSHPEAFVPGQIKVVGPTQPLDIACRAVPLGGDLLTTSSGSLAERLKGLGRMPLYMAAAP
jgi:hypothetical protein